MPQPVRNSISDFVSRLITDEAFAREIKELAENVLRGRATVDELRGRMAIDPEALRAMAPQKGGDLPQTTSAATITTAALTTPSTAMTVTTTYILDVEADGPVE